MNGAQPAISAVIQSETSNANAANPPKQEFKEESSVTNHSIVVDGRTIAYQANASTLLLKNDEGEPIALMYSVAYTKPGENTAGRPIMFLYNGGPGYASMWLHIGSFGPKRVLVNGTNPISPAPYKLVDNADTLLDKADLVFVDAIGTGYSHAVGKSKNTDFFGTQADAEAFGQFIDLYLSRYNRWNSPKFLLGESYGTFRSAAVARYLRTHYSLVLNGSVQLSSVLALSTLTFSPSNE
jgi:carboxypeptidase C (cathepsin A)